jgi:hypothetical protein
VRQEGYDRCAGLQLPNHLAWPSLVPLPGLCVNLITLNCVTRSIAQPPDWRTARRLTPPKQPGLISPHALQPNALRVRVTLSEIEPAVWRELVVPWTWHLGQLHLTIQAAFGWWDCHLHEFNIGGLRYGDPVLLEEGAFEDSPRAFDEREVRLFDFDRASMQRSATFTTSATAGVTPSRSNNFSLWTSSPRWVPVSPALVRVPLKMSAALTATRGFWLSWRPERSGARRDETMVWRPLRPGLV